MKASPEEVFAVLSNGWYYSNWVVGTSHMQAVAPDWPAVGSRLFHASGIWPGVLRDQTQVEEMVPDKLLVMTARGRALGSAKIRLELTPEPGGTKVTLDEFPIDGPAAWAHNPLIDSILRRRNVEALARLAAIAEKRTGT